MNRVTALIILTVLTMPGLAAGASTEVKDPNCIIKTNKGDITVRLFAAEAPKTVANFIGLAEGTREFTDPATEQKVKRRYYDGLIFHRVIKDFMIQGGCPLGQGNSGPGYKFEDEINADALGLHTIKALTNDGKMHPWLVPTIRSQEAFDNAVRRPVYQAMGITSDEEMKARQQEFRKRLQEVTLKQVYMNLGYEYSEALQSHPPKRGFLAMANSGPNTNGSQFFINLKDTPWLTGKHTVFGQVIKGMDVVDKIGNVPVGAGSKPTEPVRIISVEVVKPEK